MLRRLFTLLSAASLLLCVATVVVWVRSYWKADGVSRTAVVARAAPGQSAGFDEHDFRGEVRQGQLTLVRTHWPLCSDRVETVVWQRFADDPDGPAWTVGFPRPDLDRFGFFVVREHVHRRSGQRATAVGLPLGSVALASAVLPFALSWRRRRGRESTAGRCASCGYDLRATPGRCPECGVVPLPSHPRASGDLR